MTQYRLDSLPPMEIADIMEEASMRPRTPSQIKVNYHGLPYELKMDDRGDGCDLYVAEDTHMEAGDFKYISMGVSIELPGGYEAIMAARSSTFKRGGIIQTNGSGVIDHSYCGDDDIGMMPALATREIDIPAGTRLCQFRIQKKQPKLTFISVDSLGNKNRSGLGSTGA